MAQEAQSTDPIIVASERLADLFHGRYRPAKDEGDTDTFLTTAQLFELIDSHAPEMVPRPLFRDVMLHLGYAERVNDGRFVWLLHSE